MIWRQALYWLNSINSILSTQYKKCVYCKQDGIWFFSHLIHSFRDSCASLLDILIALSWSDCCTGRHGNIRTWQLDRLAQINKGKITKQVKRSSKGTTVRCSRSGLSGASGVKTSSISVACYWNIYVFIGITMCEDTFSSDWPPCLSWEWV